MAKRRTGVGSKNQTRSHKTAKRLAQKRVMLAEKAGKGHRHNRPISKAKR